MDLCLIDINTLKLQLQRTHKWVGQDAPYRDGYHHGYKQAVREVIEMAPQLWRSVDDELPANDGEYVVYFKARIASPQPFNNGRWYWGDESYMDDEHQKDITHWAPVPPPPED